jgi:hypothetical protein
MDDKVELNEPRLSPEQFKRARESSPDPGFFAGYAPVNDQWNYGIARRLATASWTAFYMIPSVSLDTPLAALTRHKLVFAQAGRV